MVLKQEVSTAPDCRLQHRLATRRSMEAERESDQKKNRYGNTPAVLLRY